MLKTNLFSSNPPVISGFIPKVHSYGFNGMEKEDEHTSGNYDFGARILDTRLGRWLSVDALVGKYPMLSPYHYAANNPLFFIDPDGKQIIPVGDRNNQTTTAAVSKQMLECYFFAAFGPQMATIMNGSYNEGSFGNFMDSAARDKFNSDFKACLATMNDEHAKSIAIGVFEAITSSEAVNFIGYVEAKGVGKPGQDCARNNVEAENAQTYFTCEPMVNAATSLCNLQSGVDVLYDTEKGNGFGNQSLSSGLVAVSDPDFIDVGTPSAPKISSSMSAGDGRGGLNLSIDVMTQIAATGRQLSKGLSRMEGTLVENEDRAGYYNRQHVSCGTAQNFFKTIAEQFKTNSEIDRGYSAGDKTNEMSKTNRKNMRDRENGGANYDPPR